MIARRAAVCATVACLVVSGCSEPAGSGRPSTSTPRDSSTSAPRADGTWSTGLDSQPTLALGGDGVVYATTAGSARYPPQVYALDVETGEIVAQRTATGQPYDLMLAPDGRLWVAGDRHPDQPSGAGINVLDPSSLVVAEHISLDGAVFALAAVGDEIWASTANVIAVIDPESMAVVRTVPITVPAYDLITVPEGSAVVAVGPGQLQLVGPDGVRASLPIEAHGAVVAAASPEQLWLRVPVDADSTLQRLGWALDAPPVATGVDLDAAGGGIAVTSSGAVVAVDQRRAGIRCLPLDGGDAVALDGTSPDGLPYAGVLTVMPDHRAVLATTTDVTVTAVGC